MQTHVKVLAVLFIAFSALGVLAALGLMAVFGGAAGIVGASADPGEAAVALPIIGLTGTALVISFWCCHCRVSSRASACSRSSRGRGFLASCCARST